MSLLHEPSEMRDVAAASPSLPADPRPDVVLDLPRRQLSIGMRAYAEAMSNLMPDVAPDLRVRTLVRDTAASFVEQAMLPGALARLDGRLVHHLSPYAPLFGPVPFVITIHDLIHLRYPAYFKRVVPLYYQGIVRRVCAAATRVIVDDERTIGDLALYLDVDPAKVRVVPLGIDDRFFADEVTPFINRVAPDAPPRPYLLYTGNRLVHKDLPTLFSAWGALPESLELDLVIAGPGSLAGVPLPWRRNSKLYDLGEVAQEELPGLYRGAAALVHPSLCEGFGLPIVEAAALGVRVIACAESVPKPLEGVVDRFPPRDHRALAAAIMRPPNPARIAEAREIARSLTWERCARATAEVYRDVLAHSPA